MVNPGKYVAQAVMAGANLIGREVQAEKAAAGSTVTQASAFTARRRMRLDEAKRVLNIEKEAPSDPQELAKLINERYETLYKANALPNGSFYLQSKIFRAKEAMEDEFRRTHGFSLVPKNMGATAAVASAAQAQAPKEAEAKQ